MPEAGQHVLFVCTGNTCRSPMAEGLFRQAAGAETAVSSAGVAALPGSAPSSETLAVLAKRGIELPGFASRMVDERLLAEATEVFCMTRNHLEMLEMVYPEFSEKYHLVCDFAEIGGEVGRDVPDPIGRGLAAYEEVAAWLDQAIGGILGFLRSREGAGPRDGEPE